MFFVHNFSQSIILPSKVSHGTGAFEFVVSMSEASWRIYCKHIWTLCEPQTFDLVISVWQILGGPAVFSSFILLTCLFPPNPRRARKVWPNHRSCQEESENPSRDPQSCSKSRIRPINPDGSIAWVKKWMNVPQLPPFHSCSMQMHAGYIGVYHLAPPH